MVYITAFVLLVLSLGVIAIYRFFAGLFSKKNNLRNEKITPLGRTRLLIRQLEIAGIFVANPEGVEGLREIDNDYLSDIITLLAEHESFFAEVTERGLYVRQAVGSDKTIYGWVLCSNVAFIGFNRV